MKKLMALFLAFMMVVSCSIACAESADDQAATYETWFEANWSTIWHYYMAASWATPRMLSVPQEDGTREPLNLGFFLVDNKLAMNEQQFADAYAFYKYFVYDIQIGDTTGNCKYAIALIQDFIQQTPAVMEAVKASHAELTVPEEFAYLDTSVMEIVENVEETHTAFIEEISDDGKVSLDWDSPLTYETANMIEVVTNTFK